MAGHARGTISNLEETGTASFDRLAGFCGIVAGAGGLLYSLAFVILNSPLLYSLPLMLSGILTAVLLTGLYGRLRHVDPGFALLGLLVGVVAALGSAIHGAYDLANAINPPGPDPASAANLPSQVDPRGMLTFGVAAMGLFVMSWLITRSRDFPRLLGYLGYVLSALMVVIYLVRLIILDPSTSPLIGVALALTGFIVSPAWYIWTGLVLTAPRRAAS